jgi:hypothetical protein
MGGNTFPVYWAIALTCAAGLAGCAPATGDFGRARPSEWNDNVLPKVGSWAAKRRGEPVSRFPLTDDERELRARGWALIMPAYSLSSFDAKLVELRRARVIPADRATTKRETYAQRILSQPYTSSSTRYRRLIDDVNEDRGRLPGFFAVSARVHDADRIREASLSYIRSQPQDEREHALMRVTENQMVIWWVNDALTNRVESYRYALERLLVETPDSEAVFAERAIMALEADVRAYGAAVSQPRFYDGEVLYSK